MVVAVLDGIWAATPTAEEVGAANILPARRFGFDGWLQVFAVSKPDWLMGIELDRPELVTLQSVSPGEDARFQSVVRCDPGTCFADLRHTIACAEGEWRWAHDKAAFIAEVAQQAEKDELDRAQQEECDRHRLGNLTFDQLLSETPLAHWHPSPPFPSPGFTQAAQARIRAACEALKALGPTPGQAEVQAELKQTVLWLNEADEKAGGVIETEEREDLFAILRDMAHAARQPALVSEIDAWRTW